MIDPERARNVLREYHATTPVQQMIDDTRRYSPELAERLGLAEQPAIGGIRGRGGIRYLFVLLGRSVHRLFS